VKETDDRVYEVQVNKVVEVRRRVYETFTTISEIV